MRTFDARAAAIAVIGLIASACDFKGPAPGLEDAFIEPDATVIADAYSPDASASGCQSIGVECAGPKLRRCTALNQPPVDTVCGWGCAAAPTPHCAKLLPTGGILVDTDLDDPGNLADINTGVQNVAFHTDDGRIDGVRASGMGLKNGIEFTVRNGVGIFRFKSLTLKPGLLQNVVPVRGANALAIVSIGPVVFDRVVLDASGDCNGSNPGPGGGRGGAVGQKGSGQGGGDGGGGDMNSSRGGAGGAFGGDGGDGGDGGGGGPNGPDNWGVASIPTLVGGSGGGGGGGSGAGTGGGGGGAVQIVTNGFVHFVGNGILFAGAMASGCGGGAGTAKYGGGGGGAGGTIVIEAPTFVLDRGGIAVNGGGGGGGNGGNSGDTGGFTTNRAQGGGGVAAGSGGDGGARGNNSHDGNPGGNDQKEGGGGGGGVGMIRFNTYSGFITVNNGFLSPSLADTSSPGATQATANVQ